MKRKPAPASTAAVPPTPAPVPLDWLEAPKVVADAPLDWLDAPVVTIGQDSDLTGVLRSRGSRAHLAPADPLARKIKQKAASEPIPIPPTDELLKEIREEVKALVAKPAPAPPKKQERQSKPWKPDARELRVLAVPRSASMEEYCQAGIPFLEGWARVGGPKTMLAAYQAGDQRLLKLIRDDRSNVWKRRDRG